MNQLSMFTGTPDRHTRQVLALTRAAKKYPSAKKKIREVKQKKAWGDYLSK